MFARVYDLLMSDIDYHELLTLIKTYLNKSDLILDAGCGSGYFLKELLLEDYQAIGIDLDDEMLSIAHDRLTSSHLNAQLYHHDLKDPLGAKVDVIVSLFDVMNYFKGIKKVFKNIHTALYDQGRFIFDVYKYEVLDVYDGYEESDDLPITYEWKIKRDSDRLHHEVLVDHELHQITQYVKPLAYYIDVLNTLKFKDIKVTDGPDERKHYIIATK